MHWYDKLTEAKKPGNLHTPLATPSTANPPDKSTSIDMSKIRKPQPVTSNRKSSPKISPPTDVLPISGSSTLEKRGIKATNRSSSPKLPIDQAVRKSSVEVKLSANLTSATVPSSSVTLHENHHATKVNSETPPKQASTLVVTPVSEIKSPQSAQVASDIVQVLDLLPEDLSSQAVTSQQTTERVPGKLVGVLMQAGVEASALSSLMIENSGAISQDGVPAKSQNDQGQANLGPESTEMTSTAPEIETDRRDHVRSISTCDTSNNEAMHIPTVLTIARDNPLSAEQVPAATENHATEQNHDAGKHQIEEPSPNNDIPTEQLAIDCGEYQGWATKPTVITWDNKDGYEVLGDRCPRPLTLAGHPKLNEVFKPGFVFKCAYCQQETSEDMHKETAIVCPGCGPCSEVRYCQKSHLLADALEHQKVCGTQSGGFPILIHMLPNHYKFLYPYIKPINGSLTPECFRQMAYSILVKRDGEIENPFLAFYNVSKGSPKVTSEKY